MNPQYKTTIARIEDQLHTALQHINVAANYAHELRATEAERAISELKAHVEEQSAHIKHHLYLYRISQQDHPRSWHADDQCAGIIEKYRLHYYGSMQSRVGFAGCPDTSIVDEIGQMRGV
jgi:hypothetical protein